MKRTITQELLCAKISIIAKKTALLFLPIYFITSFVFAQAPLISMQNGSIVYNKYANQGETALVNQIPDFSGVGYRGGGVTIPTLPVKKTITAIQGDCRALIQSAIDEVSALPLDANGFRGAVLLKAGVYRVDDLLFVRASGVVLRGEGNGVTGTVLIATKNEKHNLVNFEGNTSTVSGPRVRVSTAYVPTGAKTFSVVTNNFQVGDNVVVQKTPTQNWIDRMNMAQYGWTITQYDVTFVRKVVAISGNSITLNLPMVDPIDAAYGGADVYKSETAGRIKECGIENMRIESIYTSDEDENHGKFAINIAKAENCWIRDIVSKYFHHGAVNISSSSQFITIQDCVLADPKAITIGGTKYSFNIEWSATAILFQRCVTWGGRHDFVTGATVPGPNVFLDCVTQNAKAESGPHHRYSTGQLYDNLFSQNFNVFNRGASGSGHGWSGAQILYYNCESDKAPILIASPPGARNWGIGCKGPSQTGDGYWESWGTNILPRSLYLQQLKERLGSTAVNNIATTQQLNDPVGMRNAMITRVNSIVAEGRVTYPGMAPLVNALIDVTDNGGILTSQFANPTRPWEDFPTVIDNLKSTNFHKTGTTSLWVQYQSSEPVTVFKYSITSANDYATRDPKNWTLSGSNNGTSWTTLDTRSAEVFATRMLTRSFTITNTTPYLYYRITFSGINTSDGMQFAEWQLFQVPVYYKIKVASSPTFLLHSASGAPVDGTNVDLYSGNFGATQEWELINTSNGFKRIVSKTNPNMVLESAGVPANGINVRLGTYTGSVRQQWSVTDVGGGTYKITSRENTAQGLDCSATPANNVNVRLWSYAGGPKQKWIIESVADGSLLFNKGSYLNKLQPTTPSDLSLNYSIDGIVNYILPSADQTDLTLYNLNGQKVTNLFNGFSASGEHRLNMNALGISTGIYIIRLTSGSKTKTLKIMINQ